MTDEDLQYGRSRADWDRLTAEGIAFLVERARMERVTSYTEMNTTLARRTGLRPFDFDRQDERAAMGALLGRITEATFGPTGVMISALVHYLDANDAGPGFYALAQSVGLLAQNSSRAQREAFWVGQVRAVHDRYRRHSR